MWVALGGALGAVARYYLYKLLPKPYGFPLATFAVNMIASFLLGLIIGIFEAKANLPGHYKLALATGFCGALSTFSTFVADDYFLIKEANWEVMALYTGLSVGLGIALVAAGERVAYGLLKW
ncbi:MAG: fluoride efflux transporter CrcB [Crenarchaeota archaeon]|nr:fluoride efflux transporter CrcB [Thermoproteota archaeon]